MGRRRSLTLFLAAAAGAALALAFLILSGAQSIVHVGPIRVSLRNADRPLVVAALASLGLLVSERRHRGWRRAAVAALAASGLLAVVVAAQHAPPIDTLADIGVEELYVLLASKGRLLVGPYSRFLWHHPGPLYFWMQAPIYVLSGDRGAALYAGAWALNVASLAVLAWVLARSDDGTAPALVTGACLVFAWRTRGLLASPWTAHVPVLAALAFVAIAAALAAGRVRLLPLAAGVGTFVVQTHVGFVPVVGVLSAAAAAIALLRYHQKERRWPWGGINATAWVLAALWLLPVVEQLSQPNGNLARLWRFFVSTPAPSQPIGIAVADWSYALSGVLRPAVPLPWGGHFVVTGLAWALPVAAVQVLALGFVGLTAARSGRRFTASLAWFAAAASVVGLWSITEIRADVLDHELLWLTGLGAMNLGILVAAGLDVWWRVHVPLAYRRFASAAAAAAIVALAVPTGHRDFDHLIALERSRPRDQATMSMTRDTIEQYIVQSHVMRPLFVLDPQVWNWASGAFIALERANHPFAIQTDWLPIYGDQYAPNGTEDAIVTVSGAAAFGRGGARRPKGTVILEYGPVHVDVAPIARDR
jgi:hypothetical protein